MADRAITELPEATSITTSDAFVLQQDTQAKQLTGQRLITWLTHELDGHGGIRSIAKTGTSGLVDTYSITYADATTSTFTVTNGAKGDKGNTGATGPQGPKGDNLTITSTEIRYASSTSGTTTPSSGWQTTIPSVSQGNFLWTRTIINYSTGSNLTYYTVARQGKDGSGSVISVNNVSPDANGNIALINVTGTTLTIAGT